MNSFERLVDKSAYEHIYTYINTTSSAAGRSGIYKGLYPGPVQRIVFQQTKKLISKNLILLHQLFKDVDPVIPMTPGKTTLYWQHLHILTQTHFSWAIFLLCFFYFFYFLTS